MQSPNRRIRLPPNVMPTIPETIRLEIEMTVVSLILRFLNRYALRCNAHAGNDESQEGETGQRYQLGRIVEVGNQRCGKEE